LLKVVAGPAPNQNVLDLTQIKQQGVVLQPFPPDEIPQPSNELIFLSMYVQEVG
jgi:hypothetical protein